MMKYAKYAVLIAALFLFSGPAGAQQAQNNTPAPQTSVRGTPDPVAMQAALELLKAAHSDDMIRNMLPLLSKNFAAILVHDNPQKMKIIGELMDRYFTPTFMEHLGEFQAQVAVLYTQNLSVDDMKQLTAFYQSPLGQKYLQVMPTIAAQTMPIARAWSQQVSREAMGKLAEQLKKNNLNVPKGIGL